MLLNYLATHGRNRARNLAIALLIAVYGFRAGDIANLKLPDINWDTGTIMIVQTKTTSRLLHNLTEFCGKVLTNYLLNERPASNKGYVFLKEDGNPLAATSVSTMIFQGFTLCGIVIGNRKHGSHSLRHSLASNMLEQGISILDISHVLGHDSVDTTKNIYTKVDIGHLRLCELEVSAYE
jgi:integrase